MAPVSAAEPTTGTDSLATIIADAYRAASLSGRDMVRVAQAFEEVRRAPRDSADLLTPARATTRAIAAIDDLEVCDALDELRNRIRDRHYDETRERLLEAFNVSGDAGWQEWIAAYAHAVARWPDVVRTRLCRDDEFPFSPDHSEEVAEIRRMNRLVDDERWDEAYTLFERLAAEPNVAARDQAAALDFMAMIQLHLLQQPSEARKILEHATELDPECASVHAGWAEYWLETAEVVFGQDGGSESLAEARKAAARALELEPQDGRPHLALGDAAAKELDAERPPAGDPPETHYRRAIAAGDSLGCMRLIWRALTNSGLGVDDPTVQVLFDLALRLAPEGEYSFCLQIADVVLENGEVEAADRWQQHAIALDESRPRGYVRRGVQRFLAGSHDEAQAVVQQSIDVAPEAFDGWQTLAWIAEERGDWQRAAELYPHAIDRRPSWQARLRGRLAECLHRVGEDEAAIRHLRLGLALEPENEDLETTLLELVLEQSERRGEPEIALDAYAELRQLRGERYERTYRNLRGNLYFSLGDYAKATAEYTMATDADPNDAVGFVNLAGAWEQRMLAGELEEGLDGALDAMSQASELAPEIDDYKRHRLALQRQCRVLADYGEAAFDRPAIPVPIRVEVTATLLSHILEPDRPDLSVEFVEQVDSMRDRVRDGTGVFVPGVRFVEADAETLADPGIRCLIIEVPMWAGPVPVEERFAPVAVEAVRSAIPDAQPASHPVSGGAGCWIPRKNWKAAEQQAIPLCEVTEYLLSCVEAAVRSTLGDFVDHEQITSLIDELDDYELAGTARSRLSRLTKAARERVREGGSIADFDALCRSILHASGTNGHDRLESAAQEPLALPEKEPAGGRE